MTTKEAESQNQSGTHVQPSPSSQAEAQPSLEARPQRIELGKSYDPKGKNK